MILAPGHRSSERTPRRA